MIFHFVSVDFVETDCGLFGVYLLSLKRKHLLVQAPIHHHESLYETRDDSDELLTGRSVVYSTPEENVVDWMIFRQPMRRRLNSCFLAGGSHQSCSCRLRNFTSNLW